MSSKRGGGGPTTSRPLSARVKSARGRKTSSTRWLQRQLNDPYVVAAKEQGYRSRAAFKLIQLDERFNLLGRQQRIVDLGAAPGGWSQIAAKRVGKGGSVLAVDILPMEPMPGVDVMQLDFTEEGADRKVRQRMQGSADLVISDMAAPTTGHRQTDHLRIMMLAELAYDFATQVLVPGGAFVVKVFKGGGENDFLNMAKRDFKIVRHAKPDASRKDSSESYLVATGYRGKGSTEIEDENDDDI